MKEMRLFFCAIVLNFMFLFNDIEASRFFPKNNSDRKSSKKDKNKMDPHATSMLPSASAPPRHPFSEASDYPLMINPDGLYSEVERNRMGSFATSRPTPPQATTRHSFSERYEAFDSHRHQANIEESSRQLPSIGASPYSSHYSSMIDAVKKYSENEKYKMDPFAMSIVTPPSAPSRHSYSGTYEAYDPYGHQINIQGQSQHSPSTETSRFTPKINRDRKSSKKEKHRMDSFDASELSTSGIPRRNSVSSHYGAHDLYRHQADNQEFSQQNPTTDLLKRFRFNHGQDHAQNHAGQGNISWLIDHTIKETPSENIDWLIQHSREEKLKEARYQKAKMEEPLRGQTQGLSVNRHSGRRKVVSNTHDLISSQSQLSEPGSQNDQPELIYNAANPYFNPYHEYQSRGSGSGSNE